MMNTTVGFRTFLRQYSLYFAWVVSLVAVGGSLFFSEVLGFIPCTLCWVQRIFMYPLVLMLGIASYRNDRKIAIYGLPLSIVGGSVSVYHYLKQMVPAMSEILPCTVGVPCNVDYLDWFGFITIPLMALTAFVLISVFLTFSNRRSD